MQYYFAKVPRGLLSSFHDHFVADSPVGRSLFAHANAGNMQGLLESAPGRLVRRNLFPLLMAGELCLCLLIVNFISYTEIDWRACVPACVRACVCACVRACASIRALASAGSGVWKCGRDASARPSRRDFVAHAQVYG